MFVITATNVRDALPKAVQYLLAQGRTEYTRLGKAFVAPGPVTIHYLYPKQHVLLNPVRDANPFFHLMEAIWMLAGRDDGKFLDPYIKDFSKTYGNEDGTIMDAYGYRWRYGLEDIDQLDEIVTQMRKDASTRQAVLQMWGAGRCDLVVNSAKPCNLVAVFRILNGRLNMTVFNRSNDVIWGCCGANAVHFPILQEYLAGKIGVGLGEYWQVTTNLHLYEHHINLMKISYQNNYLIIHHMEKHNR
jgi:thymidylate synthase